MSALLEHVHAIQSLKADYCFTIDAAADDPAGIRERFAALFVADVVADYGAGPVHGADAVRRFPVQRDRGEFGMGAPHAPHPTGAGRRG